MKTRADKENKYDQLLASIFKAKWKASLAEIPFTKDEVIDVAMASLTAAIFLPDRHHASAREMIHGIHYAFLLHH